MTEKDLPCLDEVYPGLHHSIAYIQLYLGEVMRVPKSWRNTKNECPLICMTSSSEPIEYNSVLSMAVRN